MKSAEGAYASLIAVDGADVDSVFLVQVVSEELAQMVESADRRRVRTERSETRLVRLSRRSQSHRTRTQNGLHQLAQKTLYNTFILAFCRGSYDYLQEWKNSRREVEVMVGLEECLYK